MKLVRRALIYRAKVCLQGFNPLNWTWHSTLKLGYLVLLTFFLLFMGIVTLELFFIDHPSESALAANQQYVQLQLRGKVVEKGSEPSVVIGLKVLQSRNQSHAQSDHPPTERSEDEAWPALRFLEECYGEKKICPWQPVRGTTHKFFVYSAFFDDTQTSVVRVVGAGKTKPVERVWCAFGFEETSQSNQTSPKISWKVVPASVKAIRENWNLKYSALFILCPLYPHLGIGGPGHVPSYVSISNSGALKAATTSKRPEDVLREMRTGNLLPILHQNQTAWGGVRATNSTPSLGVCVKPLHFNWNKTLQLMEFIEMNRILGVNHFTFYNHSVGSNVDCLLRRYIDDGVVTVLPWELDMVSQKEIRTEGIFAALNDCVYRHRFRHDYLLLIDLDEFIFPRANESLLHMLARVDGPGAVVPNPAKTGAFSFQNAFFYLQWPDDLQAEPDLPFVTLRKTTRRDKLHPHKVRSKYICKPLKVVEVGNHFVWELQAGQSSFQVPAAAAFMHHYRQCEYGGDDCVKMSSTRDQTAYRYKDQLVARVKHGLERYGSTCDLESLKL